MTASWRTEAVDGRQSMPSDFRMAHIRKIEAFEDEETRPTLSRGSTALEKEFDEGGYGWVVVASVLLVNAHTWGFISAYAVFLAYYLRAGVIPEATPVAFAFVGGLSISIALLVSPLATLSVRLMGCNRTLAIGSLFVTLAFIGASFASTVWHLILSQGICFGFGMGLCFTSTVSLVPQWFTKRRSFANAIASSGTGFGGLVYSLVTGHMITYLGLPSAFRVLALISFVVNGACSLTVRDRNQAVGAVYAAFHATLFTRFEYLLYISWAFFGLTGYVVIAFSIADYTQVVGFTAHQASVAAAMFGLSQAIGRPIIGLVSDRVGRINVAGIGTLIYTLAALFLWIVADEHYPALVIFALFGVFSGMIWPTVGPVGAEVVGISLLPSALSALWVALVLPATFSEVICLSLRQTGLHGYVDVQVFTGFMFLASFLSIWFLRSWKLIQLEYLDSVDEKRYLHQPAGRMYEFHRYMQHFTSLKRV